MMLDRFGGYGGAFFAPMGDLFIKRALPPRNLNTNPQDPSHPCNYHVFRVTKSFRVDVGPVSPRSRCRAAARSITCSASTSPRPRSRTRRFR